VRQRLPGEAITSLELSNVAAEPLRDSRSGLTLAVSGEDDKAGSGIVEGPESFDGAPLCRVLAGTLPCASGRIQLARRDITRERPADRQLAVVPAGGGLLPQLTIEQNITYGVRLRAGTSKLTSHHSDLLTDLLAGLDLAGCRSERATARTPLEQARAGLARALMRSPGAVVIDATAPGPHRALENPAGSPVAVQLTTYVLDHWPGVDVLILTGDPEVHSGLSSRRPVFVEVDGDGRTAAGVS
jgi:ABC-type Fe3+/spermidine/putrescine transport system ATPase subunit